VQEAREALEDGSAIFLDVRSAESFETGHIPGAISMPIDEISERIDELPSNAWIITYCA
jgi:rhodanese-related sulfurtransferase